MSISSNIIGIHEALLGLTCAHYLTTSIYHAIDIEDSSKVPATEQVTRVAQLLASRTKSTAKVVTSLWDHETQLSTGIHWNTQKAMLSMVVSVASKKVPTIDE